MNKLFSISDVTKQLNLIDPITKKPKNHILRYWEKEFSEIRPKKINNRRYYSSKQVELIKAIKFFLKHENISILGVKKLLNTKINKLDDCNPYSLKTTFLKNKLKLKSKKILNKIKLIRSYGKKNSS